MLMFETFGFSATRKLQGSPVGVEMVLHPFLKPESTLIESNKDAASAGDSYRRLICKSNKDAASASRPFFGRACMCKTRRVFSSSDEVCYAKLLVNLENSDSYAIEASISASECSK